MAGFVGEGQIWRQCALCAVVVMVCVAVPQIMAFTRGTSDARVREQTLAHLEAIARAQRAFQEKDGDLDGLHDFGELSDLSRVSSALERERGQLEKTGYVFQSGPGADPDRTWFAIANPASGSKTGRPSYFLNQEGKVFERATPFSLAEVTSGCPPPSESVPAGR